MDAESSVVKHRNVSELKDAGPRVGARGDEMVVSRMKLSDYILIIYNKNYVALEIFCARWSGADSPEPVPWCSYTGASVLIVKDRSGLHTLLCCL